jgi:hypothetical protein
MFSGCLYAFCGGTTSAGWLLSLCKFQIDGSGSLACSELLIG